MDAIYTFEHARFDPRRGVVEAGGRSATLRPRAAAVLLTLLERPREVVTKDELLRAVWADIVVTENSLAQCIRELRREIGDAEEKLIRTMPRRGYVLEADVSKAPGGEAPAPRAGGRHGIMVLPLANIGGDPGQDYFAEGLTEDLTIDIGRMPGVFVIGRGTAQAYAGPAVDIREIGRELGVRYVVEGSVRRGEQDIVVNLRVCDTRDARQVWAERFEASRSNLLSLQRSMAGKVASMLHLDLLSLGSREGEDPTPDMDAHDMAARAYSLWHRSAPGVSTEAAALVQRALELDPKCAFAWVMLANTQNLALATRNFTDWDAAAALSESAARKAISLDPDNRTAHSALGAALTYQGRFEEALSALERQMDLNPNHALAHHWMGIVHILMGNARLAIRPLETAIALSPRDPRMSTFIRNLALAHLHLEEDTQALIIAERSIHHPTPWPRSFETLAAAYAVNGLMEEARAAVKRLLEHWPGYSIAAHRAEMMSHRPDFLVQRERLLEGLRDAGLPVESP